MFKSYCLILLGITVFLLVSVNYILVLTSIEPNQNYPKAKNESDFTKVLDVNLLPIYNKLIICFSNISDEFQNCNNWAQFLAEMLMPKLESIFGKSSKAINLLKCCSIWLVRDCWLRSSKLKCPDVPRELLKTLPIKFLPRLPEYCRNFTDQSFDCKVQVTVGVVFSLLFVLLALAWIATIAYLVQ